MTARHSSSRPRRNPAARKVILFGAAAVAVVVVIGLAVGIFSKAGRGFCSSRDTVTVAADPSIESQIRSLADEASNTGCHSYQVSALSSGEMATMASSGQGLPDIWIPDSVVRLGQVSQEVQVPFETVLNSVASSPVVLAVKGVDVDLGTWSGALGTKGLKLGDPTKSGTADAPILAATSEVESLKSTKETLGSSLAALAQGQAGRSGDVPSEDALLDGVAATGGAAIVSEQKGVSLLRRSPDSGVTLVAPKTGAAFLTYPLAITAQDGGRRGAASDAAGALRDAATEQKAVDRLRDADFRGADRASLPNGAGIGEVNPLIVRDPEQLRSALRRWRVLSLPGRSLVLNDISGSMQSPVPGTDKTRIQIMVQAAAVGLGQFPDGTAMGSWAFHSAETPGGKPYTELAPIAKLGSPAPGGGTHRQVLGAVTSKLPSMVGGGTDLYTTVLDAYKTLQDSYDPNAINSIILISDGANDAVSPMSKEDFFSKLNSMIDPAKPIVIVTIGVMEDADPAVLGDIARATGGSAHIARTPAEIPRVFGEALQRRGS